MSTVEENVLRFVQSAHVLLDTRPACDAIMAIFTLIPVFARMSSHVIEHLKKATLDDTTQGTPIFDVGRQSVNHDMLQQFTALNEHILHEAGLKRNSVSMGSTRCRPTNRDRLDAQAGLQTAVQLNPRPVQD